MPSDEESLEDYEEDSRVPCKYGTECYQKNTLHHSRYKHPPKKGKKAENVKVLLTTGRKRKEEERKDNNESISDSSPEDDSPSPETKKIRSLSPSLDTKVTAAEESCSAVQEKPENISVLAPDTSKSAEESENNGAVLLEVDDRANIKDKFLVEMPDDFYQFYELCTKISPKEPSAAFKSVKLLLVGPYDILNGKLKNSKIERKEEYLKHWRYYYDPPEFQTVLKGDDKEGFHLGYWRDDPAEKPVFVAKNRANVDCKIVPVAENVFGAVNCYMETTIKTANPFEKTKLAALQQKLKSYAKEHNITLDKSTVEMRSREKRVVARTFHGAGIVVPYDKKTQLGYRELAETDSGLRKILTSIDEASDDYQREGRLTHLEEVIRLATIAADECDFGTCLELGHDLFSSGSTYVQSTALKMLTMAYSLLNRPQFSEIASAHIKGRKKGCDLSVS